MGYLSEEAAARESLIFVAFSLKPNWTTCLEKPLLRG